MSCTFFFASIVESTDSRKTHPYDTEVREQFLCGVDFLTRSSPRVVHWLCLGKPTGRNVKPWSLRSSEERSRSFWKVRIEMKKKRTWRDKIKKKRREKQPSCVSIYGELKYFGYLHSRYCTLSVWHVFAAAASEYWSGVRSSLSMGSNVCVWVCMSVCVLVFKTLRNPMR